MIIKNKKEKIRILIDVAIPAEINVVQKETEKKPKEFMYTTNVEHKIYDCTGSNWSHRNYSKGFMETFGIHTRKTFNRLATKDTIIGTSHIIRKVLQPEFKVCDKRKNNNIIIIIIIIIIICTQNIATAWLKANSSHKPLYL
jgi:hypothetical protein